MKTNKIINITLGAISLIAANEALTSSTTLSANKNQDNVEAINNASLKSIESAWLKVPSVCKARAFNASPAVVSPEYSSQAIVNLYLKYSV